jgi:hypothetical protein
METMYSRSWLMFLAVTVAFGQPERAGRLNPPHLNEMPTVERVLRKITAPNPLDAAARQMGAFERLNEVIEELSGGRAAVGRLTPDQDRIMGEYRTARVAVMQKQFQKPGDDERLLPALRRFDAGPGLRDELVSRFFSPALRAQSVALSRQLQARRAAMRQQNIAFGGQAAASALVAAPPPVAVPPRAPGQPVSPPDPPITKAPAAGIDTKVFGLQMGEPLWLPSCGAGLMALLGPPPATCAFTEGGVGFATALLTVLAQGNAGELVTLKLSQDRCPAWMRDCMVVAMLEGGRLAAVAARTGCPSVEQAASQELRGKYGARFPLSSDSSRRRMAGLSWKCGTKRGISPVCECNTRSCTKISIMG